MEAKFKQIHIHACYEFMCHAHVHYGKVCDCMLLAQIYLSYRVEWNNCLSEKASVTTNKNHVGFFANF